MEKAPMTKNLLMQYTLISLFFIALLSYFVFGLDSLGISLISVGVAIGCDFLLSKVMGSKGPRNTMSAAVFGLIVAMSYSIGLPIMRIEDVPILTGLDQFLYAALISAIGLILFKKIAGLAGRKYVNPAAVTKLLVLGLLFMTIMPAALMPEDHIQSINLQNPLTKSGFEGYPDFYPMETATFGSNLLTCYSINQMNPYNLGTYENPLPDVLFAMLVAKNHGWIGGFSSILVMAIGLVLFAVCRGYIKWRITLSYLIATALLSAIMGFIFGGDIILRIIFHLFMGSSIFMAFFMATDPATTPITRLGQNIFGVGLAIITIIIQTFTGFLGASILGLVIMNLTCPVLDKIGILKPGMKEPKRKRSEAKTFVAYETTDCIRCGKCMYVCHNSLSPILIKDAHKKENVRSLMKLKADYCTGCRTCNFVCPAGIDLEKYTIGYPLTKEEIKEIEERYLKGTLDENNGYYTEVFSAKSSIDGQDGGIATALLVSGMENKIFDAVVAVKRTDGYLAEAVIAENVNEIIKTKGTTYLRVPMVSKIEDLIAEGKRKIAIVGMACEVRSARRIQKVLLRDYPDLELTIIGLFCYECFDYYKLKEEITRLLGVDLDRAEKTQIHKGKFIITIDGKDYDVDVKELGSTVEERCLDCPDFTAQYSDISVGSVGSDEGYSTVIVRSDVGKKLVKSLALTKGTVITDEITKLSIRKRKRAMKDRYSK